MPVEDALPLSVIVVTRDRAQGLPRSLHAIGEAARQLPVGTCEIIVVDNGSRDATHAVAQNWASNAGVPARVLSEARPGLATGRNTGIAAARGSVIAFTDDDCRPAQDFFTRLLAHYDADPGPAIRGGRVELGDPADLPYTIKTDVEPATYDGEIHPGGFLHGCNMSFNRAVLDRIGLFDPIFGAGAPFRSAEDTEYIYRAHRAGIPVHYVPDCVVYHDHGRRHVGELAQLNRAYAEGNGALYAKYLRDRRLVRNFYWDLKGAVREMFGGAVMDAEFGFTYRANILGCMRGMARYARHSLARSV